MPKLEKDAGFWGRTAARQGRKIRALNAERDKLVGALEEILKSDPCCCLDGDFHGDCQFCSARSVLSELRGIWAGDAKKKGSTWRK